MDETLKATEDFCSMGEQTLETVIGPMQCPPFSHYKILLTGITDARQGFHYVRLRPRTSQILVCSRGRGEVWIPSAGEDGKIEKRGAWHPCGSGLAYITSASSEHGYRTVGRNRWRLCWVVYDTSTIANGRTKPFLMPMDSRPFESALAGLQQEISLLGEPNLLEHWTRLIHGYAMRALQRPTDKSRLCVLWQEVSMSLGRKWTLPQMAQYMGLGKEQLRRLCWREMNHSPMQYLTSLRMARATTLLEIGRAVNEVAVAVGYSNEFAFSTAYRRWTGKSPSSLSVGALTLGVTRSYAERL
jgi:AraC-like DNA-binding protein